MLVFVQLCFFITQYFVNFVLTLICFLGFELFKHSKGQIDEGLWEEGVGKASSEL